MHIRVLVVDDHQLFRQGLIAILRQEPDLEVIGDISDGRRAVAQALEIKPDVVVMDVSMPNLNGIDATRQILAELPNTRVVALSAHSDSKTISEALRAGAAGYLIKDSAAD